MPEPLILGYRFKGVRSPWPSTIRDKAFVPVFKAKNMRRYQARWRQLHRILAPIMVLPLLLTLLTGSLFQIAELSGQQNKFRWLLALHKGNFGSLRLEFIYPFLNSFGLLLLATTGILMWRRSRGPSMPP